jgi:hypothetical protein
MEPTIRSNWIQSELLRHHHVTFSGNKNVFFLFFVVLVYALISRFFKVAETLSFQIMSVPTWTKP